MSDSYVCLFFKSIKIMENYVLYCLSEFIITNSPQQLNLHLEELLTYIIEALLKFVMRHFVYAFYINYNAQ